MRLPWGFKSEANWYARQVRIELGIPLYAPICMWKLAEHLAYRVINLSEFVNEQPNAVEYLMSDLGQREFSAITLCHEEQRWIIHNDAHDLERQSANISHELAHGLLNHRPAPLRGDDGARTFDLGQETEAHWLGPALLISEEAALHIVRTRLPHGSARKIYRVSNEVLQMRLNVTGAFIRAGRGRAA